MDNPGQDQPPNPEPIPFQFGLWVLFIPPVLIAIYFAIASVAGHGVALLTGFFASVAGLFWQRTRTFCGITTAMIVIVALLVPTFSPPRVGGRRMGCANNIKQIALALSFYEQRYGTFPPAYVCDKQGRPMYSWRVLILPYLDNAALYSQIKLDEPWDGPNNSKLTAWTPYVFSCPGDFGSRTTTSYVAVVGPETAWPGAKPRKSSEIVDRSHTILVVETDDANIPWAAPRDLELSKLPLNLNPKPGPGISSRHPGAVNVAFVDGAVRFLQNDIISPEKLQQLLNVSGPKPKDLDW